MNPFSWNERLIQSPVVHRSSSALCASQNVQESADAAPPASSYSPGEWAAVHETSNPFLHGLSENSPLVAQIAKELPFVSECLGFDLRASMQSMITKPDRSTTPHASAFLEERLTAPVTEVIGFQAAYLTNPSSHSSTPEFPQGNLFTKQVSLYTTTF
ncbi:hypothetical protein AHF37_11646 [Paragonimus kellicotti]|nr:hypothetical protein AHF37_11646 [Paragonimus kellicotti]